MWTTQVILSSTPLGVWLVTKSPTRCSRICSTPSSMGVTAATHPAPHTLPVGTRAQILYLKEGWDIPKLINKRKDVQYVSRRLWQNRIISIYRHNWIQKVTTKKKRRNRHILIQHSNTVFALNTKLLIITWCLFGEGAPDPVKDRLFKVCKEKKLGHGGRPQIRK